MRITNWLVAGTGAVALASVASAAPLLFDITGSGTYSFVIDSNPTGLYNPSAGTLFVFTDVTTNGPAAVGSTVQFRYGNTLEIDTLAGPKQITTTTQFYSGPTSSPVFTTGTFSAAGQFGGSYTINITSVPEPGAWAMMLAGFGVIGGVLRQRRASTRVTFG